MPWLQPSDEAAARAWAGLEILSASLLASLEQEGVMSTPDSASNATSP